MSLMRRGRDWWDWPFESIRNLPSIFDINFPSFTGLFSRPRVDIIESETEIIATAELPGVDKKDIEINVYDNILEIKGQTSVDEEKEDKNYYIRKKIMEAS
ncbi:molecular chaperone (small heat shock protein) [Caldanaerobacter subterraneus subsp. pacificus DSM 12653]|uniref:Molecular chaperone (Small heat shock protein) n=1 Tax=Caldanaerobacter subterraneus subsp. pacificus DSM 12653 TaxID=391606 RepID=A0A0F5PJ82_9THEO|nr:molecular chaperone (small heat shock protein) [Caldanaerobacter subterraneus subsp. pacificus DSM 12653]